MVPSGYSIEIQPIMEFKIAYTVTVLRSNRETHREKNASE
jgi:hypothetical protein